VIQWNRLRRHPADRAASLWPGSGRPCPRPLGRAGIYRTKVRGLGAYPGDQDDGPDDDRWRTARERRPGTDREARHRLDDGNAAPDLDDLVELGTLLAALSESVMAVNSVMMAKARLARGSNIW